MPSAWQHFRFTVGNYGMEKETIAVKDAINSFSSHVAGFYDSGGIAAGLNTVPADKIVKRRIFMDIRSIARSGRVLVIDRDKSTVRNVQFIGPTHAVAVVDEDWFSMYQDIKLRSQKPLSGKKANLITVRYFLKKIWSRWVILDYEVYDRGDEIMPVQAEEFILW